MQISYGTHCTEESLRLEQTTLKVIFLWSFAVVRTVEELLWWQRLWKKKNKRREKNRQDEGSVFGDRKHLSASGSTWLKYIVLVQ